MERMGKKSQVTRVGLCYYYHFCIFSVYEKGIGRRMIWKQRGRLEKILEEFIGFVGRSLSGN